MKGTLTLARRYVNTNNDTRLTLPLDVAVKEMVSVGLLRPWETLPLKDNKRNTNSNSISNKKRKKSDN